MNRLRLGPQHQHRTGQQHEDRLHPGNAVDTVHEIEQVDPPHASQQQQPKQHPASHLKRQPTAQGHCWQITQRNQPPCANHHLHAEAHPSRQVRHIVAQPHGSQHGSEPEQQPTDHPAREQHQGDTGKAASHHNAQTAAIRGWMVMR